MTYVFQDVKLQFDQDVEYSIDGGGTWLALAANTVHIVQGSDITVSKKVMIRSTAPDISIDKTALEWDTKPFSTINIKNGTALTDLTDVFRNLTILDTLQLLNIPRVTSLDSCARGSNINNFIIGTIPSSCVSIKHFGQEANINYFNGMSAEHAMITHRMFYRAVTNYMGDIATVSLPPVSSSVVKCGQEFYESSVDSMGSLSIHINNTVTGNSLASHTCYRLNTPYILSGIITYTGGNSCPRAFVETELLFTGLTFDLYSARSQNVNELLQANSKLIYPFKYVHKDIGNYTMFLENTPNLTTDIDAGVLADFRNPTLNNKAIALTKYLPDFVIMHSDISVAVQGKISVGAKGLYYYMYEGSSPNVVQTVNNKVQPMKLLTSLKTSATSYDSSTVYVCRNGVYGVHDNDTVTVFSPSDVQMGTIVDNAIVSANFDQVGAVLLTAQGGSVDTSSTSNQTISSSVVTYDTTIGTVIDTISLPDKINTEIVGVYRPTSASNLHILYNRYEVVSGVMTLVESYVDTYQYGALVNTGVLPNIVDYITNHYAEDNEFNCINRTDGRVIRCFGS